MIKMDQMELNEYSVARNSDPDTSHIAAITGHKKKDVREVFFILRTSGIMSDNGITNLEFRSYLLGMGHTVSRAESLRRRLSDLKRFRIIEDTGLRRDGSIVLAWTEAGKRL